jgi:hypothetical protein
MIELNFVIATLCGHPVFALFDDKNGRKHGGPPLAQATFNRFKHGESMAR